MPGTARESSGRNCSSVVEQSRQRLWIEILPKRSLAGHGNRSVLLGDHDDYRVAVLAEAEGGAVPCAVSEFRIGRSRQRQERAGGDHSAPADDDRAIMQGAGWCED